MITEMPVHTQYRFPRSGSIVDVKCSDIEPVGVEN